MIAERLFESKVCLLFLLLTSLLVFGAEAESSKNRVCKDFYKSDYLTLGPHKAFATTGGLPLNSQVELACGQGGKQKTIREAKIAAIGECLIDSADQNIPGDCKVLEFK
jgi:hypothetical protein